MSVSISFKKATKQTSIKHNNRDFSEKDWQSEYHNHIDRNRTDLNIVLCKKDIKEVYQELFQESVNEYNKKQKRKDRRIKDYYSKVLKDKTLEPQREFIIQVGEMADYYHKDGSLNVGMYAKATDILLDYYSSFQERNPNLYVYNAVIHRDEVTPHMHLNVVPVAIGYKRGIQKRPSFNKALKQQGIEFSVTDKKEVFRNFRQQEIDKIEQSVRSCQLERKLVGTNNIKDVHQFKREMKKRDELSQQNHFLELKNNKLQREVDRALELLHPKDLKLDEEPKKTLFGDKVTISQQDFYKLQASYTEFSKLSAKLEQSEKAFNQAQQLHQKEIKEMEANNLKVVKDLKQAYKQEVKELKVNNTKAIEELKKEHKEQKNQMKNRYEKELKDVTEEYENDMNLAEELNQSRARDNYDLQMKIRQNKTVISDLESENSTLKRDNKQLNKDNRVLKMKLDIVTKQLETAKNMFKDIVKISREHKELLKSTVTSFIEKQADRLIKALDEDRNKDNADNVRVDYFKQTIDETFEDDEKSKAIKAPVVEKYNNHVDEINAEIERKRQAELERQKAIERERQREIERERERERERRRRERESEWEMTL